MQTRFGHYPAGPFFGAPAALLPDQSNSDRTEAPPDPALGSPMPYPPTALDLNNLLGANSDLTLGRKPGPPELHNGAPKLPFGACVGMFVTASLPAAVGCSTYTGACGSGTLPACPLAIGACFAEAAGIAGCYAQSLGKPYSDFSQGVPPGDVEGPLPAAVP